MDEQTRPEASELKQLAEGFVELSSEKTSP
jgi:hypothetical protein